MKKSVSLLLLFLTLNCFGQALTNPAIYLIKPYIGEGIGQASDDTSAQQAIGIFTNKLVYTNLLTQSISAATNSLQQGFNSQSNLFVLQNNAASNLVFYGNNQFSANGELDDFQQSTIIRNDGTIILQGDGLGLLDISDRVLIDVTGLFTGNAFGLTNVQATNLIGQIPLANANTITTNSGRISTNISYRIGLEGTNNLMAASNNIIIGFNQTLSAATNLTAQNAYTNMLIGTNRIADNYTNTIILGGAGRTEANTATSVPFNWDGNLVMWTNVATGDCITNNSGTYIERNSAGVSEYSGAIGGTWSLVSGASPAPNSSGWGSLENLKTSGRTLTNIPASSIAAGVSSNQITSLNSAQVQGVLALTTIPTNIMTVLGATNAYVSTNLDGRYFHLSQTTGSTNGLLRINSTNIIGNPGALHISETAGNPYLISTDGAFAGLRSGFQIENNGGGFDQLMITRVLSSTQAVAVSIGTGIISQPGNTVNNSTNFNIRPPNMIWSDDAIGFEQNGGFQDNNGMFWNTMINDQGAYYYYNPANGDAVSMGIANGSSIGIGANELVWNISSMKTNAGSGGSSPNNIFNVVGNAPSESMVVMSNGCIAVGDGSGRMGGGFTNRHPNAVRNYIPFWVGLLVTNIQNSSYVALSNGNLTASGTINGNGVGITNTIYPALPSAPTFAQIGSLTNVTFMWNSNPATSTLPTNWLQFYAAPSTLTTIQHFP